MANRYKQQAVASGVTRFTKAPMSDVEFSRMKTISEWQVPFNGGDIVPVYYAEVLPHDTFDVSVEYVMRLLSPVLRPTMGQLNVDIHAFFVPNRIINESWKNVQGENTSGFWSAPEVNLASLYPISGAHSDSVQVPVGSIADYYGFPTQAPIQASYLSQCNDLKFRGYWETYNTHYRDENYQPPKPYSKLNVHNGFFDTVGTYSNFNGGGGQPFIPTAEDSDTGTDGSYPTGAVLKALYGDGYSSSSDINPAMSALVVPSRKITDSALGKLFKANKLHDAFTSVLPSPQKGSEVYLSFGEYADVVAGAELHNSGIVPYEFNTSSTGPASRPLVISGTRDSGMRYLSSLATSSSSISFAQEGSLDSSNLVADLSTATGLSINDLRTAIATQQVYEALARGGSRYKEILRTFFEIDTESPFVDVPIMLGRIRREFDLFQVAQTSASQSGNTAQGTLSAFGYSDKGGHLFRRTFLEHGYIHIFCIVRQKNLYSTYFAPDNFRRSTLDFYLPQLANISEQPVRLATLNPFIATDDNDTLGYQEAWWEYRYEPDRVCGVFRSGVENSLNVWNYADDYDAGFTHVNGEWLISNAEEVLNRTLAVTSDIAPQFGGQFIWKIDKQRPMPIYSMPGLDTL